MHIGLIVELEAVSDVTFDVICAVSMKPFWYRYI